MERWLETHHFWASWAVQLGLDHVYTTPWFAVLLSAFSLSLVFSTVEQIKISLKKTFGGMTQAAGAGVHMNTPPGELIPAIQRRGYLKVGGNGTVVRLVKHPWGYWGNALLHLGIVIVIASSLLIAVTQKRGSLHLVEGELYIPGAAWTAEERGMLAGRFVLPEAVMLDHVVPEFWETDDVKQLTTNIRFVDPKGEFKSHTLAVNQTVNYEGIRIYQSQQFGHAFFVEFVDKAGKRIGAILQLQSPPRRDKASYGNFQLEGMPYLVKAKYFADAKKKMMDGKNPLLVLRLMDGRQMAAESSLKTGENGNLGPYTARLVKVSKWAGIIFVDITGMPGIFLGFFIIILGGGLTYFTPPREFSITMKEAGGFIVSWKATRFEDFYKDEFEKIVAALGAIRRHE